MFRIELLNLHGGGGVTLGLHPPVGAMKGTRQVVSGNICGSCAFLGIEDFRNALYPHPWSHSVNIKTSKLLFDKASWYSASQPPHDFWITRNVSTLMHHIAKGGLC